MMSHHILEKAIELKVFQVWELVEELSKDWNYLLPKEQIKERVKTWLRKNLETGFLEIVNKQPPVFAIREFRDSWHSYIRYRTCESCGKTFIPSMPHQKVCSKNCKQKHYKNYHRERRKKLNMKLDSKRRWTEEETQKALELRKQGLTYRQIASILGRTPEGVKDKLKRMGVKK